MTTLDPRFLRLCDITQRILVGYADMEDTPKLFKSYINRIEKNTISSGITMCILEDEFEDWENRVDKIYEFTLDIPTHPYYMSSTDPIYVEFIVMDDMEGRPKIYYPVLGRMTIVFPKYLMDISNDCNPEDIYWEYGEYICALYSFFEDQRKTDHWIVHFDNDHNVREMREMLVVYAFLKSTFRGDAEDFRKAADQHLNAPHIAAAKMIDSFENIAWTDNGPEANITKVLNDFDDGDKAYWDKLIDYLDEAFDYIKESFKNDDGEYVNEDSNALNGDDREWIEKHFGLYL